jgi:YfiH family protein
MTNGNENLFIQPDWPAPERVKAYTSLRSSQTGERSTPDSSVNHSLLQNLLPLPNTPAWLTQKHTNIVVKASDATDEPVADASFTDETNQVCAILTADCLPILICDRAGTEVAAIHAGWRGLADDIISKTIAAMRTPASELLVWFGPAIGPEKFAIRKDVYDIFTDKNPADANAFTPIGPEQWLADIYHLARLRLQKLGINHIFGGNFCTYSDQERFFSYRRDGKLTGRIISLIWLEDSGKQIE